MNRPETNIDFYIHYKIKQSNPRYHGITYYLLSSVYFKYTICIYCFMCTVCCLLLTILLKLKYHANLLV